MMKQLVKDLNLLLAGAVALMVMFAFELALHFATAFGYCDGTGFAVAAVACKVVAYVCVLASMLLIIATLISIMTAIVRINLTCVVANLLLLATAVMMVKADMVVFIMFG